MNYIPITTDEREEMLARIGVATIEDLFCDVPAEARLNGGLDIEAGLEEMQVAARLDALARANRSAADLVCFAGGGSYDHYQPAFIDNILQRPEFFTAYTPYQPEVSQGTLQAIYEFQTGICELSGLGVANASMYDGASALAEAALMACRIKRGRSRVLVAGSIGPEKIETLRTYAQAGAFTAEVISEDAYTCNSDLVRDALRDDVAALCLPYPNYYGIVEDIAPLIAAAQEAGALVILDCNPLLLSVLKSPGDLDADIATGEAQCLGNALSFGGPGLGFFACTEALMRQIPGRLVGKTVDISGHDAYVLTLATREQHIRREKATSNICSNHALNALAAGAYLAAAGPEGLAQIALAACAKARRLHDALIATGRFRDPCPGAVFGYEFVLEWCGPGPLEQAYDALIKAGILPGIRTGVAGLLIAVTEKRSDQEIDAFVREVSSYV
ncbi:MAG: aminomethyl-transferring glycine dehydrogenase subunit GcvPA [Coriobacteriia bacterium]|nr:aminomethyl-transferring glycine dehydrogenase subunit GcvPA [Coriobacteriia bacterium]